MDPLARRAFCGALLALALVPASAGAQTGTPGGPSFDARTRAPAQAQAPEDPAAIRARERLSSKLGRQGVLEIDPRTGTPRVVARLDGFLTAPTGADAELVVLAYVRAQRAVFGLTDDDLATLRLVRRYRDDAGTTHLEWAQTWRGVTAFDNGLQAAVAADGRLVNVSGSPLPGLAARSAEPGIDAASALARVLGGGLAPRQESSRGADRHTRFSGGHDARLVLFADGVGDVRLAWRLTAVVDQTEVYDAVVDADSGQLLFRDNRVEFLDGKVHSYPYHPGTGSQIEHTVPVEDHTRLAGPNAYAFADLDSDDRVDAGEDVAASSNPPPTWDYDASGQQRSTSSLYYLVNEFHDWLAAPPFGFTAASGGFEGNDRVIAEARDGAALPNGPRDNAFMSTPPDGQSPRMSMFLWTYTNPPRDSAEDASVVFHEYAHGLSNRLIVDSAGSGALRSPQAAAMGEGWSDWYALDYLADPANGALEPDTSAAGELRVARYLKPPAGIRSEPTDCPVGSGAAACSPGGAGGYTFGDFGRVATFTQEHINGEVWAQTLWDLRQVIGTDAARRVVTGGMRLAPDNPSMLEMRNAILQAGELPPLGGAHRNAIWQVFATRGMGYFAISHGGNDAGPRENFDTPGPGVTVSGRVTDATTGAPVAGALVTLASSASGFPGDVTAVSDANGNYRIEGAVPGTYPRPLVDAPGYSPGFAQDVVVPSGGRTLDVQLVRSWASTAGGASVVASSGPDFADFGCGPGGATDLSYTTGWGSSSHNAPTLPTGEKSITIQLPQPIVVSAFNVDPAETCGDDSSAATGRYRIETSADGVSYTQAVAGQFTRANNHRANILPAPAGAGQVRFVRYTMREPQSQGTDESGVLFMDTSEFEVYGAPEASKPATTAPATSGATTTTTTTSTTTTTGTDVPAPTGGGFDAIDRVAPTGRVTPAPRQKLRTALARGLTVVVDCNEPCSGRISVSLDAKTAKRLKLLPRRSRAKSVRVALGTLRMGEGRRSATLNFTSKAKRLLKRQRSVKLSLRATLTDRSGNSGVRAATIRIRR